MKNISFLLKNSCYFTTEFKQRFKFCFPFIFLWEISTLFYPFIFSHKWNVINLHSLKKTIDNNMKKPTSLKISKWIVSKIEHNLTNIDVTTNYIYTIESFAKINTLNYEVCYLYSKSTSFIVGIYYGDIFKKI